MFSYSDPVKIIIMLCVFVCVCLFCVCKPFNTDSYIIVVRLSISGSPSCYEACVFDILESREGNK